ncbi:TolC family protein, partial [Pararobbsia alpina]|uniref:TolC family protein n=1 Tax=Pararobbsia alpina TaxID=621374 RepID=UPI001581469C
NDREKALLDQTIAAYQQVYDMMQQRFKLGVSGAGDLATAKAQLAATQTQDTDLDVMRAQLQHAIATLIGVPASNFVLPVQTTQQAIPDVPAGVPSALLERRPDIAAAERRVAAANAEIGMARAAFYPDLNLAVTVGLESSLLSPWMTASSLFWSLGPSIVGTVFDGGQHEANLRGANAQYD